MAARHRPMGRARKCTAAILAASCRLEAGVTTRTAGILPAWRGCRREAGAPSERNSIRPRDPHPLSLARRQDRLSTRKSADFLPVGQDFTIPARYFLPVGNGLRGSPAKVTIRHDRRGRRIQPWRARWCATPGERTPLLRYRAQACSRQWLTEQARRRWSGWS